MSIDFSKFSRLPSLPTVAIEALKLFHDSNSSNDQLVSVIRKDPAIVSKLLKAANSARYSARGEVTDLNRAVMLMGRAQAAPLVLSFSLAKQSMENSDHLDYYRQFWQRSFVQATAAEICGTHFGSIAFRGECYTTSLLAGLGKLALLRAEPEKYLECLKTAQSQGAPLSRIEQETFGFTHNKLSSILLQQMGLPERCHLAIRGIDGPVTAGNAQEPLLEVTRIADAVAALICDSTAALSIVQLQEAIGAVKMPESLSIESLIDQVRDRLECSSQLFDFDPPKLPSAGDLLQDALDQLSRIATAAEENPATAQVPVELLDENRQLKRRVADLLQVARLDALTGLANRGYLLQQLSERTALHRVRGLSIGLAVVDIDHFKKINDTYGHQAGDQALRVVAETIRKSLRDDDLVGRYGGEEFVAILEDANPEGLAIVGERIRSNIAKADVVFEGKKIPVTASIGLVEGQIFGTEAEFGEQLFAVADAAMYRAKKGGRNQFIVDTLIAPSDGPQVQERARSVAVPAMV